MALKPSMNIVKQVGDLSAYGIDVDLQPSAVILVAQFNKLGMDIRSFKEPLTQAVKEVMVPSIRKNFDAGGRPKWRKLKKETVYKKAGAGGGDPEAPLIRTGLLRRRATEIGIWDINGIEGYAAIRTLRDAEYGAYHNEGVAGGEIGVIVSGTGSNAVIETRQLGGFPARPFLMFHKKDENDIERVFIKWFQKRAIMAGFKPGTGI